MTERLDSLAVYLTRDGITNVLTRACYEVMSREFSGTTCLELGCADGGGTAILLEHFDRVVAVDGSEKMINELKKYIISPKLEVVHSLFEDLELAETFDTIVMAHVLEHTEDPVALLKVAQKFDRKGTRFIINVPNAHSIHRQLGVIMGMIDTEYSLNPSDIAIGHQRVYDRAALAKDVERAGLRVVKSGGLFYKPLSNAQMEKIFQDTPELIGAFSKLGERYPDQAAEIFAVAE